MSSELLSHHLVLAGQGDEVAFAHVYDATCARIYALLLRRTDSATQAEHLMRLVYATLWRQASRYDPTTQHPLPWVIVVAYRQALRQIRPDDRVPACPHTMFGDVDVESTVCDICAPSSRPPQLRREILTLFFLGGYLDSEVAATLGVPHETVISTVAEGLVLLRSYGSGAWESPRSARTNRPDGTRSTSRGRRRTRCPR